MVYTKLVIELQYFGSINYYNALFKFSNAKIDIYDSYKKMHFLNRCRISGANGVIDLSVPLVAGRSQKGPVRDIRISYAENWPVRHIRSLDACYSRAPFYEHYRDRLAVLLSGREVYLTDLNLKILEWLTGILGIRDRWQTTTCYQATYPDATDLRNWDGPRTAPAAISYTQVYQDRLGFVPGMSVLDLLFCEGPATKYLLTNNKLSI